MRLLSEYETAVLRGDLSKIKLPSSSDLYVSVGIPQVFQRVGNGDSELVENSWLYLPNDVLNSIRQNMIVLSNNHIEQYFNNEAIPCDGFSVYPILIKGNINIVVVDKSGKKIKLKDNIVNCIAETFLVYQQNQYLHEDYLDHFIYTLFNNNDSIESFVRSLLKLLVEEIPKSCAGYYFDDNGILKLRMTVGDLRRFDLMPSMLSAQKKEQWHETVCSKLHFIPAETLPDEITLLDTPPEFFFIHNGLQSEYLKNLICVILYGDISTKKIKLLEKITTLTSKINEKQFINSKQINSYYSNNLQKIESNQIENHLLKELFSLIDKQLIISRMLFKKDYQQATVITKKDSFDYPLENNTLFAIDDTVIKEMTSEEIYYTPDITIADYADQNKKDSAYHHVRSEIYFKYQLPNGEETFIAIGSPIKGGYLESVKEYLGEAVQAFLKSYTYQTSLTALSSMSINENILRSRIDLFGKLIGGYFHQIFSKITVINAETERIEHAAKDVDNSKIYTRVEQNTQNLKQYVDEVTDKVKILQLILPNKSDDYERDISCAVFLKKLPKYINGYIKSINDSNNIALRIENVSSSKLDYKITGEEIVDIILPLIVAVMENAKQSGLISLLSQSEFDEDRIVLSFKDTLISESILPEIIEQTLNDSGLIKQEQNTYKIKNIFVKYVTDFHKQTHLHIIKKSDLFVKDNDGLNQIKGEKLDV